MLADKEKSYLKSRRIHNEPDNQFKSDIIRQTTAKVEEMEQEV